MTRHTLHRFGVSALETVATVNGLRARAAQAADTSGDRRGILVVGRFHACCQAPASLYSAHGDVAASPP